MDSEKKFKYDLQFIHGFGMKKLIHTDSATGTAACADMHPPTT